MGPRGGMSQLGRVLDACALLSMPDPATFFSLPDAVQDLWVAHAGHKLSGAYLSDRRKQQAPSDAMDAEAKWREHQRKKGGK